MTMFSIITASRNDRTNLELLWSSMLAQSFSDWQWVVQDAQSSDGTVEFLSALSDPRIDWQSAPDGGIYDGLNRAMARARGRFVLCLGADDTLADPTVLADVAELASNDVDAILAASLLLEERGQRVFVSGVSRRTSAVNTVHHQSAFYSRRFLGGFNYETSLTVAADYELALRLRLARGRVVSTSRIVAACGQMGVSNTTSETLVYIEMWKLRQKYLSPATSTLWLLVGLINMLRRRAEGSWSRISST